MNRRAFIALLGGAGTWPLATRAQQRERLRRIGVLTALAADDPESARRLTAFGQGLQELGWAEGRNMRLDVRWGAGDVGRMREYAAELVALAPDVLFAIGSAPLQPVQQAARSIPIVFAAVADPVGGGFVESLARPGGNATGFTFVRIQHEREMVELLKEIAPQVTRAAVIRDPTGASGIGVFTAIQSLAPSVGMGVSAVNVRDAGEIERAIAASAHSANSGLIIAPAPATIVHRKLIIALAARHKPPAVYWDRFYVNDGGLISYGADAIDQCRHAATFVDRILRGEKPAKLPVQAPTKYELAINLKTAKALGLEIPPTVLARADEVIE